MIKIKKESICLFFKKENNKAFLDILEKERIFTKIASFIYGIYDLTYEKEKIKDNFKNNFHKLFNQLELDTQLKIYNCLNENKKPKIFDEFFEKKYNEKIIANKEKELVKRLIRKKLNNLKQTIIQKTHDELINYNYYLNSVYPCQRGNNLLLITFFAQKKMEEKGFMDKLEKNYGVYLEVDDFIKEMKQKLSEVKTYSQLFVYIGSEFGKNKSDIELIKDAYEKAKLKNYIRDNDNNTINNSLQISSNSFFRGRGRGRGREDE